MNITAVTRKTDLLHIVIQDRLNVQAERRQKLLQAKIQLKKRPYNKLRKTTAKKCVIPVEQPETLSRPPVSSKS